MSYEDEAPRIGEDDRVVFAFPRRWDPEAFDRHVWDRGDGEIPSHASPGLVYVGREVGWETLGPETLVELGLPVNAAGMLDELLRHFAV